jgi:hypothetical protein
MELKEVDAVRPAVVVVAMSDSLRQSVRVSY